MKIESKWCIRNVTMSSPQKSTIEQRCPQAVAQGDFSSYFFLDLIYSAVTGIVNVVIFAAKNSRRLLWNMRTTLNWDSLFLTWWHTCISHFEFNRHYSNKVILNVSSTVGAPIYSFSRTFFCTWRHDVIVTSLPVTSLPACKKACEKNCI